MRRTKTPLLLALVWSLVGSGTVADAQSAQCPMEAWLRHGWYTSVQGGPPRRVNALWSRADPVALFAAMGGHERGWTATASRPLASRAPGHDGHGPDGEVRTRPQRRRWGRDRHRHPPACCPGKLHGSQFARHKCRSCRFFSGRADAVTGR